MWLRFTLKSPGEELVHKAVKIRKNWSAMVADVLNHRVVSESKHFKYCICQHKIAKIVETVNPAGVR